MGWEARRNHSAQHAANMGYRQSSQRKRLIWTGRHVRVALQAWLDEGRKIAMRKAMRALAA